MSREPRDYEFLDCSTKGRVDVLRFFQPRYAFPFEGHNNTFQMLKPSLELKSVTAILSALASSGKYWPYPRFEQYKYSASDLLLDTFLGGGGGVPTEEYHQGYCPLMAINWVRETALYCAEPVHPAPIKKR